jgi:hypothetical protein
VTPQQADLSQPWAGAVEYYITPWGFLKGAATASNTMVSKRKVDGKNYTVLTWSPTVKAPSKKDYVINGYVNEQNIVDRVETWLGDNIMGDMHILAVYTGWRDFGGVLAPTKIVQTRGGWPFFQVDITNAKPNPPDLATIAPAPAGPRRWWRSGRRSTRRCSRWRTSSGWSGRGACPRLPAAQLPERRRRRSCRRTTARWPGPRCWWRTSCRWRRWWAGGTDCNQRKARRRPLSADHRKRQL